MNFLTKDETIRQLSTLQPCRYTKSLENGNMVILQIVNPDDVPLLTRILRKKRGKAVKFLTSLEAAVRVGTIVFRNSMRRKR